MTWALPSRYDFNPDRYGVEALDDDTTAKTFILQRHYTAAYVAAVLRYGLFDLTTGTQPGVAVSSSPSNKLILTNAFPRLEAFLNQAITLIHSYRPPHRRPVGLNADSLIDPPGSDRWGACMGGPTEQPGLFALPVLRGPVPGLPARPSLWEAS
jgi:hypothetical protein